MKKVIYLDNAATTKVAPEVLDAMLPYFTEHYGNPSSVYSFSAGNKEAITKQRETIAEALGASKEEIYFTAGGSESDNWALKATADAYKTKGNHIITTKIEHHAILHTAEYLAKQGFEITFLDVDEDGVVKLDDLKAAIRPTTILISVMFANNEIGTIQPIREIGAIARENGILFHTDAVQAFGQVPINVDEYNIDMLSASAHKLNGHPTKRLPNNANFSFRFIEGESLLIMLDMKGICGSSGSACTSGSLDPSHVLLAIGLPHEIAHGSLRLTLSEETTKEEIDYVVESVKEIVAQLRSMSPLYEDFLAKQAKK